MAFKSISIMAITIYKGLQLKMKFLSIGTLVNLTKNNLPNRHSMLLGLFVACSYTVPAWAVPEQLVATTCWGVDTEVRHGQSFTADVSGTITQVNMHLQIEGDGGGSPTGQLILAIFDGAGFDGTLLHSQLVKPSYGIGSVTPIEAFPLTFDVPVVSGNVYTIGLGKTDIFDSGGFCGTLADLYPGGAAYFNLAEYPGADAAFQVLISDTPGQCLQVVDQEQNESTQANFASISAPASEETCYLSNVVQSFIPTYDNVTEISLLFGSIYAYGVEYITGIFESLPSTGAQPIAESLVSVEGPVFSQWVTSNFAKTPVTPGNTYYIGFCHVGGQIAYVEGSHNDPYPSGMLYGLGGNIEFSDYDIAFKTSSDPCSVLDVEVDIKPGSDPNSINLCSNGVVPVAILGSDTFDVTDINTDTLRFAEAAIKVVGKKDPHSLCSYDDINGDYIDDLVCHYVTTDIAGIDGESTTATVNGELLDGTPIQGTDTINIVKDTCN